MWIETQDGNAVTDIENGSTIILRIHINVWEISLSVGVSNLSRVCAVYKNEATARKAFEDFKAKLRRNGEKIFKFKEDEADERN